MKLSIIIPCYNAENYIQQCIESIKPNMPYEIIVINDGSTDNTRTLIQKIMEHHPYLHLLNKPNEGVNAARRDGWQMAKGDYICFVDADDTIRLDTRIYAWLDKGYDIIKGGGYYVHKGRLEPYMNKYIGEIRNTEDAYRLLLDSQILPYMHSAFFKKELIDDTCFDISPRFKIGEDLLFNTRIMAKAKKMVSIDYKFYYYSINNTSVMHTKIWGFNYIRDFNTQLNNIVCEHVPSLEKMVIKHRFNDYTGTLMFPEVSYKHTYYTEIRNMMNQYPWLIHQVPKKQIIGISHEWSYRLYLTFVHIYQRLRGKRRRTIID